MKKIKISELPLFSSLRGLFVIGTDNDNRSVKVSLEFIEDDCNAAIQAAQTATEAAQAAATNANSKASVANTAAANANAKANLANEKATLANTKAELADSKASAANTAADNANSKAAVANTAAQAANTATASCTSTTNACLAAIDLAQAATEATQAATAAVIAALGGLIPTGLSVRCIRRITLGNKAVNRIVPVMTPENVLPNVIYQSDNRAVAVRCDGTIDVLGVGRSFVQVVPTCNTALAERFVIEVTNPTMRLIKNGSMRFTAAGGIRLN